jgi:hypothetical protein
MSFLKTTVLVKLFQKSQNNNFILIENPKNDNIILVFRLSK